jgi:hypothetical protein
MTTIKFPFERQTWYTLKELSDFEEALLVARDQDKQLGDDLRLARRKRSFYSVIPIVLIPG